MGGDQYTASMPMSTKHQYQPIHSISTKSGCFFNHGQRPVHSINANESPASVPTNTQHQYHKRLEPLELTPHRFSNKKWSNLIQIQADPPERILSLIHDCKMVWFEIEPAWASRARCLGNDAFLYMDPGSGIKTDDFDSITTRYQIDSQPNAK